MMPTPAEAICVNCRADLYWTRHGWAHLSPNLGCRAEAMSPNERDDYEADLYERLKDIPLRPISKRGSAS